MTTRRDFILNIASLFLAPPIPSMANIASHVSKPYPHLTSSSWTTHNFCRTLVFFGVVPLAYHPYFNVGFCPRGQNAVSTAVERELARCVALTTFHMVLRTAALCAEGCDSNISSELDRFDATTDLSSAYDVASGIYRAARHRSSGPLDPQSQVRLKCAELCAHHCLCSLLAATSDTDVHVPGAGDSAARVFSELYDHERAFYELHHPERSAGSETDPWIADLALCMLKKLLHIELNL